MQDVLNKKRVGLLLYLYERYFVRGSQSLPTAGTSLSSSVRLYFVRVMTSLLTRSVDMNQPTRPSLITAFFKSPPHTAEKENGDWSDSVIEDHGCPVISNMIEGASSTEVTNDGESSRCSLAEGDISCDGKEAFAVNLFGLLSHPVGSQKPIQSHHDCNNPLPNPTTNGLPPVLENGNDPQSTGGSGTKQGSLVWDATTGKLSLTPAATPPSSASDTVCNGTELIVSVQRCCLVQVPGLQERGGEMELGSQVTIDSGTCSDVEVTYSVDPSHNLDESCVIVAASSPPPPSVKVPSLPSPQPHSSSLTGPWAKIFSKPNRPRAVPRDPASDPASDSERCSVPVSRIRSPVRSPKRQHSASHSPRSRAGSRSPRTHHSPARSSSLRSPHKGAPASPLRAAVKARKLTFHPPVAKKAKLESDCAPFAGLVHVRQDTSKESLWGLPPTKPIFTFRPISPTILPAVPAGLSLKSCVELSEERPSTWSPLLPIAPDERDNLLKTLSDAHPQERVHDIFQRYCRIRDGVNTILTTPLPSQQNYRVKQSHRNPLICSIHILNHLNRAVEVDVAAYMDKTDRRKSLRLRRKRSSSATGDCEMTTETRKKGQVNSNKRSKVLGEEVSNADKGRGEKEQLTDLWSEAYRPQSKDEMIGNKMKIQQLHDWLQRWRNKTSSRQNPSDEVSKLVDKRRWRRKLSDIQSRSSRENSPIPEWVHREDDDFISLTHLRRRKRVVLRGHSSESEEEEGCCEGVEGEGVSSVVVLCGPVGSGKTAAVYACAAELGFKVQQDNPHNYTLTHCILHLVGF